MNNLAGVKNADVTIREELCLAGIPVELEQADSEVPYTIIGKLCGWEFRRAWYYYIATCPKGLGIPYDEAVLFHVKEYPVPDDKYHVIGEAVRINGHACGYPPDKFTYYTKNDIVEAFEKFHNDYPDLPSVDIDKHFEEESLREINGTKYIRSYHIDTQIGLNQFCKLITKLEKPVNHKIAWWLLVILILVATAAVIWSFIYLLSIALSTLTL